MEWNGGMDWTGMEWNGGMEWNEYLRVVPRAPSLMASFCACRQWEIERERGDEAKSDYFYGCGLVSWVRETD